MNDLLKTLGGYFLDIIETIVISLSVFLVVYLFFMQPHQVNGQSMYPTFENMEYLLTDKVTFKMREPNRGEIVVFHAPENAGCSPGGSCDFIKRIIGIPGDTVEVKTEGVYINGQLQTEPYLSDGTITQTDAYTIDRTITLSNEQYFVMGDNRSHSSDSRKWGPINKKAIVGRVFFRYWPLNKAGLISSSTPSR